MKLFVPVAVAALALMSCQREAGNFIRKSDNQKAVTIVVKAAAEELVSDEPVDPADSEETRTYINSNNAIIWGTGEYMKLALTAGETTTFATSTDASADTFNGDAEAMFAFSVTPETASEYVYQGLYPASAAATSNNNNAANYKVNLPAIQNATASSYDPAAYIMVAKPESKSELSDWTASFRRGTALNKITLKNVPDGVSISKVKITAEGKKLAGGRHFNLTTGEGLEVYGTDATIEVLYATALSGTNVDVWFTSWNAEIAEGEKLTIVAYTTDSKSYTKEITARAGGIKFQEGYLNTLGASLSGIDPETVATIDGDYVILAKHNDTYYALKGEASGTRIASVDYAGSTTSFEGDASIVWTITPSGSSYTIKNGDNFIGWNGGSGSDANNAGLIAEADYDDTKCLMAIDEQGSGIYHISVNADPSRILARNTGSAYFAFYSSTGQYSDIVLVPATALELVATPTFNPAAGEVTSGTEVTISSATDGATIYYTIDGTDPTTSSTQGTSVTITAATTIKAIAVKDGMANSEIATATYTVAGETPTTGWIETALGNITSSDVFVIVGDDGYAMTNDNGTSSAPATASVTVSGTTLVGTIADNIKWNLSGNSSDGYVFYPNGDATNWLYCTATNNGVRVGTNANKQFTLDSNGYLVNTATSRYISVYNSQDWRCYNNTNNNPQVITFYKYVAAPDNRTVVTMWFDDAEINRTTDDYSSFYGQDLNIDPMDNPVMNNLVWSFDNNDNVIDETNSTGEEIALTGNPGTATVSVSFAGDENYKPASASYTITVTSTVTNYDFETVAELNALVTSTSAEYSGYLTDAVVSFVPATNTAIVKDATGSVMFYKSGHGLKQGQTYTGAINVSAIQYNSLYSEITAWNATFTGAEAVVAPESVSLADLIGNYDDYQNAYVQVAGLTITSIDGNGNKNIHVTDGTNTYVVFDNPGTHTCGVGDIITAVGTITKYQTTEEIKVWKAADIIVTTSAPKAITFSQPAAGGSFTVKVDGNTITSGDTVASGKTVTLTATADSGYSFNGWSVSGATVADDSAAETTFTMGTTAVTIAANFKEEGSTTPDPVSINVYSNQATVTGSGVGQTATWTSGDITVTAVKVGSSATAFRSSDSDHTRFYQGWSLTVTSASNTIDKVEFTCTSSSYATTLAGNTFSAGTASASSAKVTVSGVNASSTSVSSLSGQVRISSITVTYK